MHVAPKMEDLGVMHYINAASICELVNRFELFNCSAFYDLIPRLLPQPHTYMLTISDSGRRKVLCVYTTCNTNTKIKTCTIYIQVFVLQ